MLQDAPTHFTAPVMTVIYDGACPFCASYVRLMALREAVGTVELVDARKDDVRVRDLWRRGIDLNDGLAVLYGADLYHGSDALALVSALTGRRGLVQRSVAALLGDPARARLLYPMLKAGRRLALRLSGRPLLKAP